mmetsp:Transcript_22447/g.43700  ORF Transcript_22447/g.43700 Transcript_22447/m.43700 type:complete len:137 (-) Transcript_22447:95-505(-)
MGSSGGPPQSLQFAANISGVNTDFIVTDFGAELFVVITQSAKIGSLVEASACVSDFSESSTPVYEVRVLFGDRRAEHYRAYARALIELIAAKTNRSLLLGIALKEHSTDSFRQIISVIKDRLGSLASNHPEDDDEL